MLVSRVMSGKSRLTAVSGTMTLRGSVGPGVADDEKASRRKRPRGRRAAEERDELAPPCMTGKEHCEG